MKEPKSTKCKKEVDGKLYAAILDFLLWTKQYLGIVGGPMNRIVQANALMEELRHDTRRSNKPH
jgi:hypothetical protein